MLYHEAGKVRNRKKGHKKGFTAEKEENRDKEIHVVQFVNDIVGSDNEERTQHPCSKENKKHRVAIITQTPKFFDPAIWQ